MLLKPSPMKYRETIVDFPKGWYCVAETDDVRENVITPAFYIDRDVIIFRGADGRAQVADAFCPHMGAHLASHDGKIEDGVITCPFHKWAFDGKTGRCRNIPYTNVLAPVSLTLYPTREVNDTILMWYSPTSEEPDFEPFDMATFPTPKPWVKFMTKTFESTAPYRDLFENLFDTAHVQQLHKAKALPEIATMDRTSYGMRVVLGPQASGEIVSIDHLENNFTGTTMCSRLIEAESFALKSLTTATPIDHERFRFTTRVYLRDMGSAEANAAMGERFAENVLNEIDQDFKVLNFKKHLPRPNLCAGDGPILKFRAYQKEYYA